MEKQIQSGDNKMKFSLPKSRLSHYLQNILQVVPSKSTLPILTNVLVEALENKLKISATDLDISITTSMESKVLKKGSASLPARILFEIIKELPETEVSFETSTSRVEIKIPNGSYKIATVSPDDYPKLPAVNTKKEINLITKKRERESFYYIKNKSFACSIAFKQKISQLYQPRFILKKVFVK